MARPLPPPPECANCGADIPPQAKSCPECGADERTGWRETDIYDGIDLPPEAWDEEPSAPLRDTRRDVGGLPWYWWATGLFLLVAIAMAFLGLR
ncbi:zinc ribbon domain-containing protein [Actomonas aquatica]|uniref:Zinc-ribbon domain-containing protein n=1 Tax=Actomonas aquatica TaxID=2866162 RepID=A0ABZ1C9X3_9BACT|nr:zinc ribbon domain-containing protein [Opitutus sp. WL0086]WRQ88028.1 zinc-ribbon domain-containing protein [Opitutus sp. WL0086]